MKKNLLIAAMALLSTAAMAQATYTDAEGNEYEFKKHAYLQLQGGAQYTLGESSFGDLISPNVQVGLGYQFNPWLGARIAVGAWQSKGGYNTEVNTTYKYKYVAPGVDVMVNLSNALCGYNPFRTVNVSAFVGAAANISFDNDEAQNLAENVQMQHLWDGTKVRPVGRAGLALDFRLSDVVSLGAEVNANIISDHYNSKHADNADWYFNGLVGLKFNLGKTYTKKVKEAPVVVSQPEPVKEVAPAPAPEPVKEVAPAKVEDYKCDVFFTISSTSIVEVEEAKVAALAEFLKNNPSKKVEINGYADAGTGTDMINERLAKQRAEQVVKMLTEKYGIDASRIKQDSHGSKVQPFSENDKNRVSICTTAD